MDSKDQLREGSDYHVHFDPMTYIDDYYSKIKGFMSIESTLESLHKIYATGRVKGKCLLEIGSGPTLHMVMPAAKWFDEIILSDFAQVNRDLQTKWLNQDTDSADWTLFFKHYSKLDGNEDDWLNLENEVRSKIHNVVPCDVHLTNPLHPLKINMVDAICTSLCLEAACPDVSSYEKAMRNVASLLKPGGKLVLMGVLNNQLYAVGHEQFYCLSLQMDDVISSMNIAGLTVLEQFHDGSFNKDDSESYKGPIVIHAEKNT